MFSSDCGGLTSLQKTATGVMNTEIRCHMEQAFFFFFNNIPDQSCGEITKNTVTVGKGLRASPLLPKQNKSLGKTDYSKL